MKSEPINLKSIFKKAPASAIMTVIFFVAFIRIYLFVTTSYAKPYYIIGLLFAIPTFTFGIITYLTVKEKLTEKVSIVATVLLALIFPAVMFFGISFHSMWAGIIPVTNIDNYERVLRLTGYPDSSFTSHFPDEIPVDAQNIDFYFMAGFLQGGSTIELKYETNQEDINNYVSTFSKYLECADKPDDSEVLSQEFFEPDDNEALSQEFLKEKLGLPEDFTIYIIDNFPYGSWDLGRINLVAISEESNTMFFYSSSW